MVGSNPLGALAAFGVLRACSEISELSKPRLYWRMEDDWIAVLSVPSSVDESALLNHLEVRQRALKLDVFCWSEDIRVEPEKYRLRLIEHGQKATLLDRLSADYYAAFGSDAVTDGSQGLVKPTAFHMTSGQQEFLKIIAELAESLLKDPVQAFKEALFGPWKYSGRRHSLGWDPATERLYAYRHKDPSKKTTDDFPNCVPGAIWLAVEALPLFPTTVQRRRLETIGFIKRNRNTRLVWPIWTEAIVLDTLKMLLATSELRDAEGWDSLGRRGVAAIYESVRSEFGKGYAILHPPSLAWNREYVKI